jgi:predicted RNA-binding Zn-ribbon protein involved in translation (DUF1610 family)
MSFYRSTLVKKTKKEYQCQFCGRSIPKGESCYDIAGVWYEGFFTSRLCLPCERDMKDLDLSDGYDAFDWWEYSLAEMKCPKCDRQIYPDYDKEDSENLNYQCCECGSEWKVYRGWK